MKDKSKSIFYALICVVLWALIPVVSKIGQSNLDNYQFLFWSNVVSLITFVIIAVFTHKASIIKQLSLKSWAHAAFLGFLGTYLYYILLYFGYAHAKGLEVVVIQYCWPVFVILFSVVLLKEKFNKYKVLSIVLGFVGVMLIVTKGHFNEVHFDNVFVNAIVLIAALVFGLFSVLSKKIEMDPIVLVLIYFLSATIYSFLSMVIFSTCKLPLENAIIPIIINGVLVNGISYIFWVVALKKSNASFVAPFVFITPVLSTIFLVVFFNEAFELVYVFGMVAVIIAGLISKE